MTDHVPSCERQPSNVARSLSRVLSSTAALHPRLYGLNEFALRLDQANPLANYVELNHQSKGAWALQNTVFRRDPELLDLFKRYGRHSKGQLLQDLAYLKFNEPLYGDGFFIEVGVGDGTHVSNTYFFEKEFGWGGILVEPNPQFHSSIRANRIAELDVRAAFSSDNDEAHFLVCSELSRLNDENSTDKHRRSGEVMRIPATTLTKILNNAKAPNAINFMSIDTEGSELDVLKGIDFSIYKFDFITVEHNYATIKQQAIRSFMRDVGYRCVSTGASLWDDWFAYGL